MRKKIAFIINPISGIGKKKRVPPIILRELDMKKFEPEIVFTQYAGHATKLALDFVEKGYEYVVAVGGDGTVHEIASVLKNSDTALGIIPRGSGNGLARHLGISLNMKKAIRQINQAKITVIDYCLMNNVPFFCTAGIGFDAYVSMEFDKVKIRGFWGYIRKIITCFFDYKSQEYHLAFNEQEVRTKAFLITLANASQWGFNAYIAPKASVKDGRFNITILKKLPFFTTSLLALKLFSKTLDNSKHINTLESERIVIKSEEDMLFHLDGDPFGKGKEVIVEVIPAGLKVFCYKDFQ